LKFSIITFCVISCCIDNSASSASRDVIWPAIVEPLDSSVITRHLGPLLPNDENVSRVRLILYRLFFVWLCLYNYICVCVHFCDGNYLTEKRQNYTKFCIIGHHHHFPHNGSYGTPCKYIYTWERCCLFLITQSKGSNQRQKFNIFRIFYYCNLVWANLGTYSYRLGNNSLFI